LKATGNREEAKKVITLQLLVFSFLGPHTYCNCENGEKARKKFRKLMFEELKIFSRGPSASLELESL
jgi:hypothetical protein